MKKSDCGLDRRHKSWTGRVCAAASDSTDRQKKNSPYDQPTQRAFISHRRLIPIRNFLFGIENDSDCTPIFTNEGVSLPNDGLLGDNLLGRKRAYRKVDKGRVRTMCFWHTG
jgi:hypothetical protein